MNEHNKSPASGAFCILQGEIMGTIAIYREAKKGQVSSLNHLVNAQEYTNQKNDPKINKIFIIDEAGEWKTHNFTRDGNNQNLINQLREREQKINEMARADYKAHKLEQKAQNPSGRRVCTVLQSKELKKEFVTAIGGDKKITDLKKFEENARATALKILKKKGLDGRNLLSLTIHYDEKTPHVHVQYNNYSWEHKTTASELTRIRLPKNATQAQKREAYNEIRQNFAEFQTLTAQGFGMTRGDFNSRVQHKTKAQYFNVLAEQSERLKAENSKLRQQNRELTEKNNDIKIEPELLPVLNNIKNIVKQSTPAELQIMHNLWRPKNTENFDFSNALRREIADFWDEQAIKKQKQLNERKQKQLSPVRAEQTKQRQR
jgi:hypothetical protein